MPRVEALYEDLRNQWLGEPERSSKGLGMALLLRGGLASWMQVWRDRMAPASRIERTPGEPESRPGKDQGELVMALVSMALSTTGKEIGI